MEDEKYLGSKRHLENLLKANKKSSYSIKIIAKKRKEEYYKNPKLCKECGMPIDYHKKFTNTFCSSSCGVSSTNRKRKVTYEHKNKTSQTLKDKLKNIEYALKFYRNSSTKIKIIECEFCKKLFVVKDYKNNKNRRFCSKKCVSKRNGRIGGLKSIQKQSANKRSKNEKCFAEMCEKKFNVVLTNEQIFNGWDADVIIEDYKIAVLWNGKWHYEKIKKNHSVKQVQNRDEIKIKEIRLKGYTPYIIKDMGKYNKNFVEKEFEIFLEYCKNENFTKKI